MNALVGFAPFAVFSLLERSAGVVPALAGAAAVSVALLVRDRLRGQREVNMLEAGSAVVFAALVVAVLAGDTAAWSLWRVRMWVDAGLVVVVLAGLVTRRPFTLQHARRQVSPQTAASAGFLRANLLLSGVWGLAFAVLTAADAWMVLEPAAPAAAAIGITVGALAAAAAFTVGYAARARRRVRQLGQSAEA